MLTVYDGFSHFPAVRVFLTEPMQDIARDSFTGRVLSMFLAPRSHLVSVLTPPHGLSQAERHRALVECAYLRMAKDGGWSFAVLLDEAAERPAETGPARLEEFSGASGTLRELWVDTVRAGEPAAPPMAPVQRALRHSAPTDLVIWSPNASVRPQPGPRHGSAMRQWTRRGIAVVRECQALNTPLLVWPSSSDDSRNSIMYALRAIYVAHEIGRPDVPMGSLNWPPGADYVHLLTGKATELRHQVSSA